MDSLQGLRHITKLHLYARKWLCVKLRSAPNRPNILTLSSHTLLTGSNTTTHTVMWTFSKQQLLCADLLTSRWPRPLSADKNLRAASDSNNTSWLTPRASVVLLYVYICAPKTGSHTQTHTHTHPAWVSFCRPGPTLMGHRELNTISSKIWELLHGKHKKYV